MTSIFDISNLPILFSFIILLFIGFMAEYTKQSVLFILTGMCIIGFSIILMLSLTVTQPIGLLIIILWFIAFYYMIVGMYNAKRNKGG